MASSFERTATLRNQISELRSHEIGDYALAAYRTLRERQEPTVLRDILDLEAEGRRLQTSPPAVHHGLYAIPVHPEAANG